MKLFVRESILLLILLLASAGVALAETAYLTDNSSYRVRAGKSGADEVVGVLYSGNKVEVLVREDGWAKIRMANDRVGWIVDRFLVPNPPDKLRVVTADAENKRLRGELAAREKELQALKEERDALNLTVETKDKALEEAEIRYNNLKGDPNEAMQLRVEKERLEKELQTRKEVMEDLEAALWKNNIKIFALGAGILFFGMLCGLFMGRKNNRRSYY